MAFPNYGKLKLAPYNENPESAIRRTTMETGPAKQARIKSRVMVDRSVVIRYTGTEFASFKSWFKSSDCNWGAAWFDWTDPIDNTVKQARIVNGAYTANPRSAGDGAPVEWDVALTLETWES